MQPISLKNYTRAVLFFPIKTDRKKDYEWMFNNLISEVGRDFNGCTFSIYNEETPPFFGNWMHFGSLFLEYGKVALIIIDYDAQEIKINLEKYLSDLKQKLQSDLGEKIIWIVIYEITRIVDYDP